MADPLALARGALDGMLRLFGKPRPEEYVDDGASYHLALSVVASAKAVREILDAALSAPPAAMVRDDFAPADMAIMRAALVAYSNDWRQGYENRQRAYAMFQVLRQEIKQPAKGII